MMPQVILNTEQESSQTQKSGSKTLRFNFNQGEFVLRDGRLQVIDGTEALKQWIEKVIRTEMGRFRVYDDTDYGVSIEDLIIGQTFPRPFVQAELRREITEALLKHPGITGVNDIQLQREDASLTIRLTVQTSSGQTVSEEVTL